MKKLFILLLLIAAGYATYLYFFKKEVIEIKDSIVVSQASGLDMHAGITSPPKYAHIEGVVKNTGEKSLTNILIIYKTGYDSLKVMVGFLTAGASAEFKTNSIRVRTSNPQYSVKEIKYDQVISH